MSRNRRSPKQILGSVVVLIILIAVLYLNRENQSTGMILTPPPTETSPGLAVEQPDTQTPEPNEECINLAGQPGPGL